MNFHHYLPIPDEILHGGFYVTSGGQGIMAAGKDYPPVRHPPLYHFRWEEGRVLPEFALILIASGSGLLECRETGPVRVRARSAILLFPGVWHRYRPDPKTGWSEKWFQFNGEFAHALLDHQVLSPRQPVVQPRDFSSASKALDRLLEAMRRHPSSNSLLLSLHALGALSAVLENRSAPSTEMRAGKRTEDPLVAAALDYIWTRSHQVLSVPDVARATGRTRRTLERRFAAVQHRSARDEIVECRFSRAERLLRETGLPVKTVVTLAGFGSLENMRQIFLAKTGCSPLAYRRRMSPTGRITRKDSARQPVPGK